MPMTRRMFVWRTLAVGPAAMTLWMSCIASGGGHHHSGPLTAALDVTGKLHGRAGSGDVALELTVAPLDAAGTTTEPAIPLVADRITLVG
jgi:hypothetical protein